MNRSIRSPITNVITSKIGTLLLITWLSSFASAPIVTAALLIFDGVIAEEICASDTALDSVEKWFNVWHEWHMCRGKSSMKAKELADKIFSVNKNIRYVSVVGGPENELLESRMREGIKSLSQEKDDHWFAQVLGPVMLEGSEKLERDLGHIAYSMTRYDKLTMVVMKIQEYVVTLSVEPQVTIRDLYDQIIRHISL